MEKGKAGREIFMPPGRRSDSAAAAKRGVKQGDKRMDEGGNEAEAHERR